MVTTGERDSSAHWAESLAQWAIPEEILAAAPESPWGFPTELFSRAATAALSDAGTTPSRRRALEAIPEAGVVLDVGVGGGAASLPLAPPAHLLAGVDESEEMLHSFGEAARRLGVAYQAILGRWPEVSDQAPVADVVVCHHVAYNVADLLPFFIALDRHARRRVVVELTERHPLAPLNPLWSALHGLARPEGPTALDALAVAEEAGVGAHIERFERPSLWSEVEDQVLVAFARRRLCVGPDRDSEIAHLLDSTGWRSPRTLVTLWWDVQPGGRDRKPQLSV